MSKVVSIKAARKSRKRKPGRSIYKASASDQFFTPPALLELAREALGGPFTLDPATSPANPTQARFIVVGPRDGGADSLATTSPEKPIPAAWMGALRFMLEHPAEPLRVWCNPPYGFPQIRNWISALEALAAMCKHRAGILALVPARTGTGWYKQASRSAQLLCEVDGRITFLDANGEPPRDAKGRPTPARWSSTLFYWGPDRARVARVLRRIGVVRMCRALPPEAPAVDERQLRLV